MLGANVLLVGDDPASAEAVLTALEPTYAVARATMVGAMAALAETSPQLVVLTVAGAPGPDGPASHRRAVSLCRSIRTVSTVPIVVIAGSPSEGDHVDALEAGADVFLVVPVRAHEFDARLRALLRRFNPSAPVRVSSTKISVGDLVLDLEGRTVAIGHRQERLARKEFELLRLLMSEAGRVVRRETLVRSVWGPHLRRNAKTLDVHVRRIREKIEIDCTAPERLMTVRGVGFRIERTAPILVLPTDDVIVLDEVEAAAS